MAERLLMQAEPRSLTPRTLAKEKQTMIPPRFRGRPISSFFVALSLLFATLLLAQTPNSATLTIRIANARNANGVVRIALFQTAEGFPGDASKALRTQPAKIDPQTLTAQTVFSGIPQGTYAVMVFHDENGNGKLDKNMVGIPKEGYGASNNPAKRMRPPTFDETRFSLNSDQTIEIRLLY
jgi:uncharacterized protein (DUF2141 family)